VGEAQQIERSPSRPVCWPGFVGRDWLPAGFLRKVSESVGYISSSSPRLVLAHSSNWTETYANDSVKLRHTRQHRKERPLVRPGTLSRVSRPNSAFMTLHVWPSMANAD
jgi:hypothetical protein